MSTDCRNDLGSGTFPQWVIGLTPEQFDRLPEDRQRELALDAVAEVAGWAGGVVRRIDGGGATVDGLMRCYERFRSDRPARAPGSPRLRVV